MPAPIIWSFFTAPEDKGTTVLIMDRRFFYDLSFMHMRTSYQRRSMIVFVPQVPASAEAAASSRTMLIYMYSVREMAKCNGPKYSRASRGMRHRSVHLYI